jgi:hypothetical protein
MIWNDLRTRNAQFTVVLRVAANFRPLTAFVSYWVANGYKGNTTFQVQGDRLRASGVGSGGPVQQDIEVPEQFSIGSHPVAGDGWHLWYVPVDEIGRSGMLNLLSLEASADTGKPILGTLVEMPYEVVGRAVTETPAGRFDTTHYRLLGTTDLWVTGPDRMLVRMVQEGFDREYLLAELQTAGY